MNCPHIEIDMNADGFSQEEHNCGDCGGIWSFSGNCLKIAKLHSTSLATEYIPAKRIGEAA